MPVCTDTLDSLIEYLFTIPLIVWGTRALLGRPLRHALARAFAWLLGTVFLAAGLGILPPPQSLPAGAGGMNKFAGSAQAVARWAVEQEELVALRLEEGHSSRLARQEEPPRRPGCKTTSPARCVMSWA